MRKETKTLTHETQAVLDAYDDSPFAVDDIGDRKALAAVLRALVKAKGKEVTAEVCNPYGNPYTHAEEVVLVDDLLSIANELEGSI